ncbi:hypothetical protein SAY87_026964 [Trapa incisa]|uniref:SAC domain-containing protein n=1 Tax=Trapa incisa TaxID=236973 RepID=A0AAN7JM66_9MYRT|nr:hypothetical protein SAY87_026964 [Trapa incisa]
MEDGYSSAGFRLYEELELQEFQNNFVIRSKESPSEGFSIGRREGNIVPLSEDTSSTSPYKTSTIYGVVGTIRLPVGAFVLVITSRNKVGNFLGFPVYRVNSMRFLYCNEALKLSTSQEKRDEAYFMTLLRIVESTPGLYFSYRTDITLNLQRRYKLVYGWMTKPIWKQADPRFVWNKNLMEELIECKVASITSSSVDLSFQAASLEIRGSPVTIALISRRCTRRLGTRMWRRGANLEGDTANFIETEQILEAKGFMSSLLQIRGSIPLLWQQIVDLSYKPQLKIINHEETSKVVERHLHDLSQRYGDALALDLTDKHGDEGQLGTAYALEVENLPNVRYVHFDFHHICGNSNFENLEVLYREISEDFEKQGYFLIDAEGSILGEQKGIIRSNCIDCLDRTNVTQSFLAQKSLNMQLQRIAILAPNECFSISPENYGKFRALWAEQGDELSLEYTGTHALKGDLVRYGRQTLGGMIKDGISALSRYYLNNFQDGIRQESCVLFLKHCILLYRKESEGTSFLQDAIDLVSGHYTFNKCRPSSLQLSRSESLSYLPVASALVVGGLTVTTISLQQQGRGAQQFIFPAVWAGVAAGVMAMVKANGRQFCSRPRLRGLL